ncbi:MAG: hypothetical protein N4A47_03385 [Clostridia bacterium]|nr:hypothetical protein [Clostridia bacterium]
MEKIRLENLVEKIVENSCGKYKFITISGNGAAGKTFLSKAIVKEIESNGENGNFFSMDDFMVDMQLRNMSVTEWECNGELFKGRYTSCIRGSYFLRSVESIMHTLRLGMDCYMKPEKEDMKLLKGNAKVTVIEGIASVFLENNKDILKVFVECDMDVELDRRLQRDKIIYTAEKIRNDFEERNSQFIFNIMPHKEEHDLILKSNSDFTYSIEKDIKKICLEG